MVVSVNIKIFSLFKILLYNKKMKYIYNDLCKTKKASNKENDNRLVIESW